MTRKPSEKRAIRLNKETIRQLSTCATETGKPVLKEACVSCRDSCGSEPTL